MRCQKSPLWCHLTYGEEFSKIKPSGHMFDTKCIFSAHIMCMVHTPFNLGTINILNVLVMLVVCLFVVLILTVRSSGVCYQLALSGYTVFLYQMEGNRNYIKKQYKERKKERKVWFSRFAVLWIYLLNA